MSKFFLQELFQVLRMTGQEVKGVDPIEELSELHDPTLSIDPLVIELLKDHKIEVV
jgi:hypothetical protein